MTSSNKLALIVPQEIHCQQMCPRSKLNFFQCLDCILKMDPVSLLRFIREDFGKMQKCSRCEKCIAIKEYAFFCPNHHLVCPQCTVSKCPRCESFVKWDCHSKWHNISVKCEWNCDADINIFEYLQHQQLCLDRKYKCPGMNCLYVSSLKDLKKHWHLSPPRTADKLYLHWKNQAFYWLLPCRHEIVYVTVEVFGGETLITVHENDAIFPASYIFLIYHCQVVQKWASLKDDIGRCVKISDTFNKEGFCLTVELRLGC